MKHIGNINKGVIPGIMTVAVVDMFKFVQVQKNEAEIMECRFARENSRFKTASKARSIQQPGQWVMVGKVFQFLMGRNI